MKHRQILINSDSSQPIIADAPIIVSASRATDIPAFYADWFFNRLEKGYSKWQNPFSGKTSYIAFKNTRFIVFWSKNPAPLLPYLPQLKQKGIGYYLQYTLNDYSTDNLEPHLPDLSQRIDTFKRIVDSFGPESVVWRFDPLILTENIGIEELISKIHYIGKSLCGYTQKLVFSFADIQTYRKVALNLSKNNIRYINWNNEKMEQFASKLSEFNKNHLNLQLFSCSERIELEKYDIFHNRCIDPELMARISPNDAELQNFLYTAKKDPGQRKYCGCIISKDIGQYNTCPHLCRYCYANSSSNSILRNYYNHRHTPTKETLI